MRIIIRIRIIIIVMMMMMMMTQTMCNHSYKWYAILPFLQSHCLILWNVFPRCPLHVGQALAAALAIRDGFKQQCAAAELPDLTVAMGLWSGAFVSGTITFGDMMSYACLGQGPERAEALQAYAALSGRGIVCSSRVFDATKAAPKQRLVPVDVLTFSPKDLCGEIVYECVGEVLWGGGAAGRRVRGAGRHRRVSAPRMQGRP